MLNHHDVHLEIKLILWINDTPIKNNKSIFYYLYKHSFLGKSRLNLPSWALCPVCLTYTTYFCLCNHWKLKTPEGSDHPVCCYHSITRPSPMFGTGPCTLCRTALRCVEKINVFKNNSSFFSWQAFQKFLVIAA